METPRVVYKQDIEATRKQDSIQNILNLYQT